MPTTTTAPATTDAYAVAFRAVYDAARAAGASKADAADDATHAGVRAWRAEQDAQALAAALTLDADETTVVCGEVVPDAQADAHEAECFTCLREITLLDRY